VILKTHAQTALVRFNKQFLGLPAQDFQDLRLSSTHMIFYRLGKQIERTISHIKLFIPLNSTFHTHPSTVTAEAHQFANQNAQHN